MVKISMKGHNFDTAHKAWQNIYLHEKSRKLLALENLEQYLVPVLMLCIDNHNFYQKLSQSTKKNSGEGGGGGGGSMPPDPPRA